MEPLPLPAPNMEPLPLPVPNMEPLPLPAPNMEPLPLPVPILESFYTCRTISDECHSCRLVVAKYSCVECRAVKYCSKVCQKQHWEIHKTECQVKKQLGAAIGLVHTTSSDKFEVLRFVRMSGELNEHNGNFAAAELMYTTVLEDRKKLLGEFHFDTLESMNDLGYLSEQQGQIAKAKSLYEDCLKKCREVNDSKTLLTVMNNLANLYIGLGKDDEGKVLLFECLDKAKANIGTPGNRTLVLLTLEQLAGFYNKREQWASCEPFQVEFMEMKKAELGKDDPEVIKAMGCVACTYALQGKNAFAEPLYIEAHGRRRATLGEDHPLTLESLNSLASFYFSVGKFALSKTILIECLEKSKKALGPKHPFSKKLKRNLKAFPTGY